MILTKLTEILYGIYGHDTSLDLLKNLLPVMVITSNSFEIVLYVGDMKIMDIIGFGNITENKYYFLINLEELVYGENLLLDPLFLLYGTELAISLNRLYGD